VSPPAATARKNLPDGPRDLPFSLGEFGAVAAVGVWFGDQTASFDSHPVSDGCSPRNEKVTCIFGKGE